MHCGPTVVVNTRLKDLSLINSSKQKPFEDLQSSTGRSCALQPHHPTNHVVIQVIRFNSALSFLQMLVLQPLSENTVSTNIWPGTWNSIYKVRINPNQHLTLSWSSCSFTSNLTDVNRKMANHRSWLGKAIMKPITSVKKWPGKQQRAFSATIEAEYYALCRRSQSHCTCVSTPILTSNPQVFSCSARWFPTPLNATLVWEIPHRSFTFTFFVLHLITWAFHTVVYTEKDAETEAVKKIGNRFGTTWSWPETLKAKWSEKCLSSCDKVKCKTI